MKYFHMKVTFPKYFHIKMIFPKYIYYGETVKRISVDPLKMGVEQQMKNYINQRGKPHIIYFMVKSKKSYRISQ